MAAVTRPPNIGDARVPCPQCGGLIHPVAGRCKHCKEDLSALRAGRPQAAMALPSLVAVPAAARIGHDPTPIPQAAAAIPIAIPAAREGSQPILPQRPTSQWRMKAQKEPGAWLRNWPLIVIVLAVLAIVAAVVIMVLPTDGKPDGGKRQLMPAPAPDRMDTNPMPPKASQADPWGQPGDPDTVPGMPDPAQPIPQNDPLPDDPDDPADPDDLFGGLGSGGVFGGQLGGGATGTFVIAIGAQACKKAASCATTNKQMLDVMCGQFSSLQRSSPSSCLSGKKCLDAIESLDCDAFDSNPVMAALALKDCVSAMTEC